MQTIKATTFREPSRRQSKPSEKVKDRQAMELEATERRLAEKGKREQRARRHLPVEPGNSSDDENVDLVNNMFSSQITTSKPQIIKERALVQRYTRVPLSQVQSNVNEDSELSDSHSDRGRSLNRTPRYHKQNTIHSASPEMLHHDDAHPMSPVPISPEESSQQKRQASSNESARDAKYPRISSKVSNRPKAADYDDITQAVIALAASEYRCKISTVYAFPDTAQIIEFSASSWQIACEKLHVDLQLTPRLAKLLTNRGAQLRGEVKTKTRPLVEAYIGFESGQHRRIVTHNRAMAERLKEDNNFVYQSIGDNVEDNVGLYKSKLIQKVINMMWFRNKHDEGVSFSNYFNPITKPTLALVLTGIECCLDEWLPGIRSDIEFSVNYKTSYDSHLKELDRFKKHTMKHKLMENILTKLYNRGRFHAGAQPVSSLGLPVVPVSAFKAALREYENDPNTDTDGENGDSD